MKGLLQICIMTGRWSIISGRQLHLKKIMIAAFIIMSQTYCYAQNKKKMKETVNPMLCKPERGFCELPIHKENHTDGDELKPKEKTVKLIYFTDPICSSCWGIEAQLRKLNLEYGTNYTIEYRMGGLLPDWNYNVGGISKPSDVATHWEQAAAYYDMPIDGDVWLEDPLHSSYPPSIACKAAQMQDSEKSIKFLREIREMVFLRKKNITKWEHLEHAAKNAGLNIGQFKTDYNEKAGALFEEDLKLTRSLGVNGFPTLIFTNAMGNKEQVYGSAPYQTFENALLKVFPAASKTNYDKSWKALFNKYHSLTTKEFAVLSETSGNESEKLLNKLTAEGHLTKTTYGKGALWTVNKPTH
jgi:predicted DsbA family dithiol-disulfide isomerase